jgi:hypothetical protein
MGIVALGLVLSAAAFSGKRNDFLSFAQYQGSEPQEWDQDFRFVVVGDRTATPQWGLMPQAFSEINHLCPDFVISVGDLIDGYGGDSGEIHQFWNEFDQELSTLRRPFVYVPGNHDIWNATSRGIYEARYGPSYRSFNYRGFHFITLDTEETDSEGRPAERIQGKQLEWLRGDVARNRNARGILIFMHRPIWQTRGFDQVYGMLEGLQVHIFAGHDHRYSYQEVHGIPHIILSAVAGSMAREGPPDSGYFRHYVFATARGNELRLALIRLGGVLSPDVTRKPEKSP